MNLVLFVIFSIMQLTKGFRVASILSRSRSHTTTRRLHNAKNCNYYITTPIYYVNGEPHLGHAYTSTMTDIIARFYQKDGYCVKFVTGTDEHGQKVEQSAKKANKSPLEFADVMSSKFTCLTSNLGCCNNDFIRTTEARHSSAAQALWQRLKENDQIYLGHYEGFYSIRDEAYYAESELVDGKAPTGADVEWMREESYFFRLSNWTEPLLKFYENHPDFIQPESRRNEVIQFVAQPGGLRDLSISRTAFKWGIPVPGDEKHVMYVWLDALVNYLSALGFPDVNNSEIKKFWPAALHVVGKDIIRFHAIYWPAFLMAAGLEPPKRIFAHGWWTKDGEKMSKSLGNVLDPNDLMKKFGVDYLRYYMASEVPFGSDGNFQESSFVFRVNADLANEIGNLVQRVLVMIEKNFNAHIPEPGAFTSDDIELLDYAHTVLPEMRKCMDSCDIKGYCALAISVANKANKYAVVQSPWNVIKTDKERAGTILYVMAENIRQIAVLMSPVVPTSCFKIFEQLQVPCHQRDFSSISSSGRIQAKTKLGKLQHIFPRIEMTEDPKEKIVSNTTKKEKKLHENKLKQITVDRTLVDEYSQLPYEKLSQLIKETGDQIRSLKARAAEESDKIATQCMVNKLLAMKEGLKFCSTKQSDS